MARPTASLERLRGIRNTYSREAEAEKQTLLTALGHMRLVTLAQVVRLHEDLLFVCAFPGSAAAHDAARRLLGGIERRLRLLPRARRLAADDTGIAGSNSRHAFAYPIVRWLVRAAPREVEVDWRHFEDPSRLDDALALLVRHAEGDAFGSGALGTRAWVALARRADAISDLQWLVEAGEGVLRLARRFGETWDGAEVPVVWRLAGTRRSVTHNALDMPGIVLRRGMRRVPEDPVRHIATPLREIRLLPRRRAEAVIDVARAAVTARCREVHGMNHPNPREVYLADLGEGAELALIGVAHEHRLSLEANYGYLLLSNGVPLGYGGVTPLFHQGNTGINVFDPFRGSEAGFLWAQMLRAFHALFAIRRFVINAYQFGAGNAEAIASGAYWFYYRLGFRPTGAAERTLAAREAARMQRDRDYRSDAATLRVLASGDLHLDLPGFRARDFVEEASLPRVGAQVAERLARVPVWSREDAERTLALEVAHVLGAKGLAAWPAPERRAFERLAPVAATIPHLDRWPAAEKRALVALFRAKGRVQERGFVTMAQARPKFYRTLIELAAR